MLQDSPEAITGWPVSSCDGLSTNMDCPSTLGISPCQSAPVFSTHLKVKKWCAGLWCMTAPPLQMDSKYL